MWRIQFPFQAAMTTAADDRRYWHACLASWGRFSRRRRAVAACVPRWHSYDFGDLPAIFPARPDFVLQLAALEELCHPSFPRLSIRGVGATVRVVEASHGEVKSC
jgi:hypothetical protein